MLSSIWQIDPRCDEILKRGIEDKLSAKQIADLLNLNIAHYFNKNMVIGRAHRTGLTWGRPKAKEKKPKQPSPIRSRARIPSIPISSHPEVVCDYIPPLEQRKALYDLGDRDCRWPLGDPQKAGFAFCGGPALEGYVYCENHCRASYWMPRPIRNEGRPKLSGISLRARL